LNKKKFLVLVENYPKEDSPYAMSYVHSRNIEYAKRDIIVDVLSFSTRFDYNYEGINVYASVDDIGGYDTIISHAPNVKNHIKFLLLKLHKIKSIVFFFHGHEVLNINKYYPKPYHWQKKKSRTIELIQNLYDEFKLMTIKLFLKLNSNKIKIIYVSRWMKEAALECLGDIPISSERQFIVNNPANAVFLEASHCLDKEPEGDFITIRPLDERKYAVDLVIELAKNNPNYTFDIYGKGSYFKHNEKPNNVRVYDCFIKQNEIPLLLNKYRYSLMPTRLDAQGVMMCEIASFGMPLITSDLDVCKEMLDGFENVLFVENNQFNVLDLSDITLPKSKGVNKRFDIEKIVSKETGVFLDD
jgi:glycosyltransferase involved in cell wall biosynthesis